MATLRQAPETFTVSVDLSGNGIELELLVIPDENYYNVKLDGVILSQLEYQWDNFPKWRQIAGKVDQAGVNAIGEAIENQLA